MMDDDIENERLESLDYIKSHSFPTRELLFEYLTRIGFRFDSDSFNVIYDISDNIYTHVLYRQPNFKESIQCIGKCIFERGGHNMMQVVYYSVCFPFQNANSCSMRGAGRIIEFYWDGIGEWQR
jgi:hypothetical protein